jgi:hypothetical protein
MHGTRRAQRPRVVRTTTRVGSDPLALLVACDQQVYGLFHSAAVIAVTAVSARRSDTSGVKRRTRVFAHTITKEDTTMNFLNLGQSNYGLLSGPQTNAAVVAQGFAFLNSATISQANYGIGSGPQTNVAVVTQGH